MQAATAHSAADQLIPQQQREPCEVGFFRFPTSTNLVKKKISERTEEFDEDIETFLIFWRIIVDRPAKTGLDPRELGNCSGPQGLGDMRLEKLLSICQPITQQWHATGSFGTLGRKDKRRPGTLEHHSPSFIARIHGPILTFRRSLDIL